MSMQMNKTSEMKHSSISISGSWPDVNGIEIGGAISPKEIERLQDKMVMDELMKDQGMAFTTGLTDDQDNVHDNKRVPDVFNLHIEELWRADNTVGVAPELSLARPMPLRLLEIENKKEKNIKRSKMNPQDKTNGTNPRICSSSASSNSSSSTSSLLVSSSRKVRNVRKEKTTPIKSLSVKAAPKVVKVTSKYIGVHWHSGASKYRVYNNITL